jgi:hypothetical protein
MLNTSKCCNKLEKWRKNTRSGIPNSYQLWASDVGLCNEVRAFRKHNLDLSTIFCQCFYFPLNLFSSCGIGGRILLVNLEYRYTFISTVYIVATRRTWTNHSSATQQVFYCSIYLQILRLICWLATGKPVNLLWFASCSFWYSIVS